MSYYIRGSPDFDVQERASSGSRPRSTVSPREPTMKSNTFAPPKGDGPQESSDESQTSVIMEMVEAASMDQTSIGGRVVYVIAHPHNFYKIGISEDPIRRLNEIQEASPYKLEIIAFEGFREPEVAESILHDYFSNDNIRGEWFDIHDELMTILFSEGGKSLREIVVGSEEYTADGAK